MASKPNIRFNDFSDEWEEIELNKIAERITRKNTNLESTLPLTISAQYGLVDQRDFFNAQIASKDVSGYFLLKKGEFAYNKSYSSEYPFGTIKRLDKYEMGVLSTLYILFSHKNINSDFLLHYYDSNYWHNEITKIAAEGARNHGLLNIAPEDFFNTKLKVTKNENEQKVIGLFFTQITSLIDSTQEKLDKAIILKKSMLEKMFPKEGEKVPELRFKGFSGEWEEKYLGDCFTERDERSAEGELISVTINQGVVRAKDLDRLDSSSNDKSNYKIVCKGDLAYNTMRMWQGAEGYSPYDGILSPAYTVCIPSNDIHTQFFAYMFKKNHIIHQFKINSQGLTSDTWNLKFNNFALIKVRVPNIDEQKTIANYFENIDKLITSYNDELEKLKTIKKSLLEKMFV